MTRWLLKVLLALGAAATVLSVWLWFSLLSPWGYAPPTDLAPIRDKEHTVFAYGTLRQPLVRWLVVGRTVPSQPAVLPDFHRQGLNLNPQTGANTAGEVFTVTADELLRLDRYERLGIRYNRIRLTLLSGTTAWVYLRLEEVQDE